MGAMQPEGTSWKGRPPGWTWRGGRVGPAFLAKDEILWDLPGWGVGCGAVVVLTAVCKHEGPFGGSDTVCTGL